jgi:hypothetical protein
VIDLILNKGSGERVWLASNAPEALVDLKQPPVLVHPGRLTPRVLDLSLNHALETFQVQSMGHHARSCYLGRDEAGLHYFAKGIGWCLSPGWEPQRGNTGVLTNWAATRERDLSLSLASLGLRVPEPMAIYSYEWLPSCRDEGRWPAEQVPDLGGEPAVPSLYIYRYPARFRLMDIPSAAPARIAGLRRKYFDIISEVRRSICSLQAAGGHDYSLGLHNVWEDAGRVDFEYVLLHENPHPVEQLNTNPEVWRSKEWVAFRCLAFELADLLGVEAHSKTLLKMTTPPGGLVEAEAAGR